MLNEKEHLSSQHYVFVTSFCTFDLFFPFFRPFFRPFSTFLSDFLPPCQETPLLPFSAGLFNMSAVARAVRVLHEMHLPHQHVVEA